MKRFKVQGSKFKVPGLLFAGVVLGLLTVGCTTQKEAEARYTKVLMIGNSFSISCMAHLPKVAKAASLDKPLVLGSLYIGGCSLSNHWANVLRDGEEGFRPYRFDLAVDGERVVDGAKRNVCDVLRMKDWDIVTVQQASHFSWKEETYAPWGDDLVAKVRELAPHAKIVVQETWSYTPWDKRFKKWGIDQNEMYERLHAAYGAFAKRHGLEVIPFGTAVQEWRRRLPVKYTDHSFGGDVVGGGKQDERDHFKRNVKNDWEPNCDVFHLGRKGEYFQALVWAKALLGADLEKMGYKPDYVTDDEAKLMKKIAGGEE